MSGEGVSSAFPSVREVEAYLHRNIPLSAAMGVTVTACDAGGVRLLAPLAPNINYHATAFGGSISAVAILAAWTTLHVAVRMSGRSARLVVQRNSVEYLAPVSGEFEARCGGLTPASFQRFGRTFDRHAKARATLSAELSSGGARVATFTGEYVAIRI